MDLLKYLPDEEELQMRKKRVTRLVLFQQISGMEAA